MSALILAIRQHAAPKSFGMFPQGGEDVGLEDGTSGPTAVAMNDFQRWMAVPNTFAHRLVELCQRLRNRLAAMREIDDQRFPGPGAHKIRIALRAGGGWVTVG
jgi:hypothetical protein